MAPKLHIQILLNLAVKKNQKQVDLLICRILPDNSPFLARFFLPGIILAAAPLIWGRRTSPVSSCMHMAGQRADGVGTVTCVRGGRRRRALPRLKCFVLKWH